MNGNIIVMAIGFVLGAACAIIVIGVMFFSSEAEKDCEGAEDAREAEAEKGTDEEAERQELLKRQWENFFIYDGTEKDQMPIGDE